MRQGRGGGGRPVCFDALRKSPCAATGLSFIPLLLASLPPSTCSFVPWPKESNRKNWFEGEACCIEGASVAVVIIVTKVVSGVISLASVVESDSVLIIVKAGSHLHPMPQ